MIIIPLNVNKTFVHLVLSSLLDQKNEESRSLKNDELSRQNLYLYVKSSHINPCPTTLVGDTKYIYKC